MWCDCLLYNIVYIIALLSCKCLFCFRCTGCHIGRVPSSIRARDSREYRADRQIAAGRDTNLDGLPRGR